MTIAKAKMYKTARIAVSVCDYKVGDFVAVEFMGRGSMGGFNFRITAPYQPTVCVPDHYLTDFVL